MPEYIEREALLIGIKRRERMMVLDKTVSIDAIRSFIENRPAVDVAPVRHARWEQYHDADFGWDEYGYQCTACHYRVEREKFKFSRLYCPLCGAKMDGGGTNEQS